MKKLILFALLLSFCCCTKPIKSNTINLFQNPQITTINSKDIYTSIDTTNDNPRLRPIYVKKTLIKKTNVTLNGLFKIITNENTFFISRYKNGVSPNSFNITSYYLKNKIVSIRYEFIPFIGGKYIYVPNYSCDSNITGYYMSYSYDCGDDDIATREYSSDCILDTLSIQQHRKGTTMEWTITSNLNTPYRVVIYNVLESECP